MARTISKIAIAALCLLALAVFTPQAKASSADFGCSGAGCSGTFVKSGSNYSSTGIGVTAGTFNLPGFGSDESGQAFSVAFDTSTGAITITDTTDGDATLTGHIVSFSANGFGGQTTLTLDVDWTTPSGFAGVGTVGLTNGPNGTINTVDISVNQTPEPASLLLLGTGLIGLGGVARRRWSN